MPNTLDLAFLALVGIGWPVYDYVVDWPRMRRWADEDVDAARGRVYRKTLATQWIVCALGAWLWIHAGRSWAMLGIVAPHGGRAWAAAGIMLPFVLLQCWQVAVVARSEAARARVRELGLVKRIAMLLPTTPRQLVWMIVLSLTAGFCEEFLFRGWWIVVLAPVLGWWGAAAVALVPFALLHGYQGRRGVIQSGLVGLGLTILVAAGRSLVPAMLLHAFIDASSGVLVYIAQRGVPAVEQRQAAEAIH